MAGQHTENLFRRFKGETVSLRTISGGIYEGRVIEITNDYVCLSKPSPVEGVDDKPVFIFFTAIESVTSTATDD